MLDGHLVRVLPGHQDLEDLEVVLPDPAVEDRGQRAERLYVIVANSNNTITTTTTTTNNNNNDNTDSNNDACILIFAWLCTRHEVRERPRSGAKWSSISWLLCIYQQIICMMKQLI